MKTAMDCYSRRPENLKKEAHRCYLIAIIFMNLFSSKLSQYFVMCRLVTHKVTAIICAPRINGKLVSVFVVTVVFVIERGHF